VGEMSSSDLKNFKKIVSKTNQKRFWWECDQNFFLFLDVKQRRKFLTHISQNKKKKRMYSVLYSEKKMVGVPKIIWCADRKIKIINLVCRSRFFWYGYRYLKYLALLPTPAKQEKKKNVFCAVF
jgi:hypothetical protein